MRSPSTTSPSSQHSQPRLELLGHFDDFITSDSSAESASDELEEFKPPPGERTRRVSQLNRVVRPRRLAALRNSVTSTFCQQQQLRRNSPRKKSLLPMGAASAHPELDEPKKSSTTGKTTAPKNASNTTTPKRSTAGVVRKSSSIGSSSSSQDSSSLLIGVNVPTLNVPVSMLKRGEHFSTAQRKRGQLRGVGRLFSLQMATTCCLFNDCSDASRPSAIARSSTGSRRVGRARRSRGGSYTTTSKVLEQSEISAVDGDGAGMEKGRVERGQHQRPKRGGRRGGGRGGPRGERQQRIAGSALILDQSNYDRSKGQVHKQYSSSSAESSSEEEDNARVGRSDKKLPLTSAEEEVELSSSSSSTTTDEEEEEEKVERPRGNLLGMVSPPHVPLVQQRQQIPYYSPPLVASTPLFQSRRKKNPNSKFVMLTGTNHQHPSGPLSPDFDYTNPYETSPNSNEFIDPYQRKMRDALITYRFLGYLRPLWGPFMLRNLHYMRCMRPPRENFNCHNAQLVFSDNAGGGIEPIMPSKFSSDGPSALLQHSSSNGQHHQPQQQMELSRTSSRISNKFPATIRPSFIRNNLFFGQKKAIVHCFHVSECNGRLSPMKLIPSATFEMKVNERIRNISIDLPDGMHLGVLDGDKAKLVE
uniref:Protein kinase domain-containing protein n=1 Tax=Globodera pallida TaxID=36090 RepID=A0A183BMG5_GLOPA